MIQNYKILARLREYFFGNSNLVNIDERLLNIAKYVVIEAISADCRDSLYYFD